MNVDRELGKCALRVALAGCVIASSLVSLTACNRAADKPASQVVAKVNKQELTVHQLNFVLQQQRGMKPEQAEAARKNALERLVDQELAIQKAGEIKLDRDPGVMQQIEAARREIIARNYFDRVGDGASHPSDAAIQKYFDDNPALFSQRRVYQLQEWFVEVPESQAVAVTAKAQSVKTVGEFNEFLRLGNYKFESNQAVRTAEQLPLNSLASFSKMNDGDSMISSRPNGLRIVKVVAARLEPVGLTRVKPVIEQFLVNEHKTKILADDLKALRTAATVSYVGDVSTAAGVAPATPPTATPNLPASIPASGATADTSASAASK